MHQVTDILERLWCKRSVYGLASVGDSKASLSSKAPDPVKHQNKQSFFLQQSDSQQSANCRQTASLRKSGAKFQSEQLRLTFTDLTSPVSVP